MHATFIILRTHQNIKMEEWEVVPQEVNNLVVCMVEVQAADSINQIQTKCRIKEVTEIKIHLKEVVEVE